jgi:hypothetical protein
MWLSEAWKLWNCICNGLQIVRNLIPTAHNEGRDCVRVTYFS